MPAGMTQADGRLTIPRNRLGDDWIEVFAQHESGAGSTSSALPPPNSPPTRIRLHPIADIGGVVRFATGVGAAGATVLATPLSVAEGCHGQRVDRILEHPETLVGRADAEGRFRIQSVQVGVDYELIAGGTGLVQKGHPLHARAGTTGVELEVAFLYGVRVVFSDGAGSQVRNCSVGGRYGLQAAPLGAGFKLITGIRNSAELGATWPEEDRAEFPVLLETDEGVVPGCPIEVDGRLPGFAPFHVTVTASQAAGNLATEEVVLQRDRLVSESLAVVVEDALTGFSPARTDADGILHLEDASGGAQYGLFFRGGNRALVQDVPVGTYLGKIVFDPGETTAILGTVVVSEKASEISLRMPESGSATIELTGADGSPYRRGVRLFFGRLVPLGPGGKRVLAGESVSFRRPPFQLPGLTPGQWTVMVESPGIPGAVQSTFDVEANDRTTVRMHLDG